MHVGQTTSKYCRTPSLASPAEKVTACPSAMPTSNTLSGMAFCIMHIEQPVGMAGVIPTIRLFLRASSSSVSPNTSWYLGPSSPTSSFMNLPVSLSNLPGACHAEASSSAGRNPLPFTVCMCSSFGPSMFFISFSVRTSSVTSCPYMGPK